METGAFFLCACLAAAALPSRAAPASWRERLDEADGFRRSGKMIEAAAATEGILAEAQRELGPGGAGITEVLVRLSRIDAQAGAAASLPELEKRLTALNEKDASIWSALGMVLRGEGRASEAQAALKTALTLKPGDREAAYELSRADDDLGRFEDELPLLKGALEADPRNYFLYSQLARTLVHLGRMDEAKKAFAQAKKVGVNAADAYIAEGYFYARAGRAAEARASFESAVAVDTASPFGYHHLGSFFVAQGDFPDAERNLRRALELLEADPKASTNDLIHTMQWLGDALVGQKRYTEAEALYLKSLEMAAPGGDRQLWSLRSLAKLYEAVGDEKRAEATLTRAADMCSIRYKCGSALYGGGAMIDLGELYLSQGRTADARRMADAAAKFADDFPLAQELDLYRNLAAYDAELGDSARREALFARLLEARKSMPFNAELVWVEEGAAEIAASHGRYAEAEALYRRALDIIERGGDLRDKPAALAGLAAVLVKQGKAPEPSQSQARPVKLLR